MDVHFQGVFMSCTRRIGKLLSLASPYVEYLEERVVENVSAATTAVVSKGAEILTKENARKAYGSMQSVFSSCRRNNKESTAATTEPTVTLPAEPVVEEPKRYSKKLM
jgi:hypothetical protein